MANINAPKGCRPIGTIVSTSFEEHTQKYVIPASDTDDIFIYDAITNINGADDDGIPIARLATETDEFTGIIVAFIPDPLEQNYLYRRSGIKRYALVIEDETMLLEIQANGILDKSHIGKTANIVLNGGDKTTGLSKTQLDISSITDAGGQLTIIGIIDRPDNELGQYCKVRCLINRSTHTSEEYWKLVGGELTTTGVYTLRYPGDAIFEQDVSIKEDCGVTRYLIIGNTTGTAGIVEIINGTTTVVEFNSQTGVFKFLNGLEVRGGSVGLLVSTMDVEQDIDVGGASGQGKIVIRDGGIPMVIFDPATNLYTIAGDLKISGLQMPTTGNIVHDISIDGTFAANSDDKLSTQKAIKTLVDTHPGTQATVEELFVAISNGQTTFTITSGTPDITSVMCIEFNRLFYSNKYTPADFSVSGTTLTLQAPFPSLLIGEQFILRYNIDNGGGHIPNVTPEKIGLGAEWTGSNWKSTNPNINNVREIDDSDTSNPLIITQTAYNNPVDSTITNFKIANHIDKYGNGYPHYGSLKPVRELADYQKNAYGLVLTSDGAGTATLIMPKKEITGLRDNFIDDLFDTRDKITLIGAAEAAYNVYMAPITAINYDYSATHFSIQYAISGTPATPATGNYSALFSYHPKPWHNGHHFVFTNPDDTDIFLTDDIDIPIGFHQRYTCNQIGSPFPAIELDNNVRVRGLLWSATTKGTPTVWVKTTPPYNIPELLPNETIEIICEGSNIIDGFKEFRIIGVVGNERVKT